MKKRFLAASLVAVMALSLAACGGGKPAETTAAEESAEKKEEEPKQEEAASGEMAPEDYKGTVVVYSPHDADPLNAGL